MKIEDYQKACRRTECDQRKARRRMDGACGKDGGWLDRDGLDNLLPMRLNHGALGIVKEGGEILALLEKWIYYGQELDVTKLKEELGDVLWYCALVANCMSLDLGEVLAANMRKLKARYPARFTEEQAANRDEAKEQQAVKDPEDTTYRKCKHCLGTGNVTCEWDVVGVTTCPACNGAGALQLLGVPVSNASNQPNNSDTDTVSCAECGADYPRVDYIEFGYVCCSRCRCTAQPQGWPHVWELVQTVVGSGCKCRRCGKTEGY